jgi:hypothetical protein
MKYLKYQNEFQFLNDFYEELKKSLDYYYQISKEKKVGLKVLDLFIENQENGNKFSIEIKGGPSEPSLPPEIIPSLENIKKKINEPKNHFIVISLSKVDHNVKLLFENRNLEVFEYHKHKNNFTNDFILFLKSIDH